MTVHDWLSLAGIVVQSWGFFRLGRGLDTLIRVYKRVHRKDLI